MGAVVHPGHHWHVNWRSRGLLGALLAALLIAAGGAILVDRDRGGSELQTTAAPRTWTTDGSMPIDHPQSRAGLAWFEFGDSVTAVSRELGAGVQRRDEPVMYGPSTTHVWTPAAGASLEVTEFDVPGGRIDSIDLDIAASSSARFALWGGLVAGASTMADVEQVWGEPIATEDAPGLRTFKYSTCLDGAPVGVFFSALAESPAPVEERAVTHVWIGLLDEPACQPRK